MYQHGEILEKGESEYIERLCERVERGLDEGLLPIEVFRDDRVFRAEMERIFTRSWVFVAHETEIPERGDFVLRKVGLDQVIVSRSADGKVNVLLNHCRHRGSQLCHEDSGNTARFRCPYHGWTYKVDGSFVGAPDMREAYGGRLDSEKWGLLRAPKVESFYGFIFTCLSENAPPLIDYLGGAAWIFQAIFGLHKDGLKVLAPPERFIVRADWKSGAENFAGDAYHVGTTHYSATATNYIPGDLRDTGPNACGYVMGNGHGFIGHRLESWFGPMFQHWGYPKELVEQFDLASLDDQQRTMIQSIPPTIGNVFPNMSYLRFPSPATPGGFPIAMTNIRVWQPIAPGVLELWNWQLDFSFMPEEYHQAAYMAGQVTFGSAGLLEQDDTAVWEGIAKIGGSPWGRKEKLMLHYGQIRPDADPEWHGPGQFYPSIYGEYLQEAFWRRWLSDMRGKTEKDAQA